MPNQRLQVTQRDHPPGEAGVFHSLEQVATRVAAGGTHPKVKAWANEQLVRARQVDGVPCRTDRERAQVLLRAVQKKLWIPDPVNAEFIAGAHLLACDRSTKNEICFLSGDCDDLVTLLGACFLTVGLNTMVVGHAYGASKNISHVLTAVRLDGRWQYADPTPEDFKLGECVEFSRERILSVPNIQMLCDDDVCLSDKSGYSPDKNDFVTQGLFVGVDGIAPKFAWLRSPAPQMLGQSNADKVVDSCLDSTLRADFSTAAARERAFGSGARCAADAYCAVYRIPPGICSSIAGPVADAIADLWSSIFGGDPTIDCARASNFDPCHECKLLAQCAAEAGQRGIPNPIDQTRYSRGIANCMNAKRRACLAAEKQRIADATIATADRAAAGAKKKRTSKVAGTVAVGAAGAAAWYFWDDIARLARKL